MDNYKHTQIGKLIIAISFFLIIYFWFIFKRVGFNQELMLVIILIVLVTASFSTLTVSIDEKYLKIKFGYGIFRKRYLLKDIASVSTVKNHWYYGWGIRYWVPTRMWVYNVSGFDAVEIVMNNGRVKRIGTDEPRKLEQAINQSINL